MPTILNSKSIYYNDVNLINDKVSQVRSRLDVPKELHRFIVSPMAAVVGKTFANEAAKLGLTICLHRFCTWQEELDIYLSIPEQYRKNVYCSIGLKDIERFVKLQYQGGCFNFVVDIALGFHPDIEEYLKELQQHGLINKLILGNIHTGSGYNYLREAAFQSKIPEVIIRTGVGNGISCESSDATGINRGQITEISECRFTENRHVGSFGNDEVIKRDKFPSYICADGGIHKIGNACKAFACGADYVMMGGFWMQAREAESNLNGDSSFWGGASTKQQQLIHGKKIRHSEGKELKNFVNIADLKPLKEIVDDLWLSVASYVSYSGYETLTEVIGNGIFEIKENSLPPKNR
jgi:hypothetical protein